MLRVARQPPRTPRHGQALDRVVRLQPEGRACMATAYRPTSVGAVLFAPDVGRDASSSSAAPQHASSVQVLHLMGHGGAQQHQTERTRAWAARGLPM